MNKNKQNHLRHAICAKCSNIFAVKDGYQLYGKRSPLLLKCGHSQCESCVRDSLKLENKISCAICSNESSIGNLNSMETLRNEFPLNIYLVGNLLLRAYKSKVGDNLISFKTKSSNVPTKKSPTPNEVCFGCSEKPSDVLCKQCTNTFCSPCFQAVHSSTVSLKTHEKLPLEHLAETSKPSLNYCLTHKDQKIEFYCETCDQNTCSYCALCQHIGHTVVHKLTENEKKLDKLKELMESTNEVYKRLLFTRKKAVNAVTKPETIDNELASVEKLVSTHFDHLHAVLQLKEAKILELLQNCRSQSVSSLQTVMSDLDISIKEVASALQLGKEIQKPQNLSWMNMEDVLGKLVESVAKPSHIVFEKSKDESGKEEEMVFKICDEAIFDKIMSHCEVRVPVETKYVLLSEADLPEGYVIEDMPSDPKTEESPEAPQTPDVTDSSDVLTASKTMKTPHSAVSSVGDVSEMSSKSSRVDLNTAAENIGFSKAKPKSSPRQVSSRRESTSDSSSNKPTMAPVNLALAHTDLHTGSIETVTICHFMSPSDFYVHRKGTDVELRNLMFQISRLSLHNRKHPNSPVEGGLYLVHYENDNKWYRGKIIKVHNLERIQVCYVDYGNVEFVSIESLRHLPSKFTVVSPMAIHCQLYDCYPNPGKEWSPEAIKMMAEIISGCSLAMYVMRTDQGSKLEVDLTKFDDDSPVSVRDALLFHELAFFVITNNISKKDDKLDRKVLFKASSVLKEGETIVVNVTHVIHPSDFYIREANKNSAFLGTISRQLNDIYSRNPGKDLVYTPFVGLSVAALDFKGIWHRAQVIDLPGNHKVTVFLVDSGETLTLPWDNLRKLQMRFLRMNAQAIRCALSDVIPLNKSKCWSNNSIRAFEQLVIKKKLKASITAKHAEHIKVALYESTEFIDKCINALLVKRGFAESVGITSTLAEFPKQQWAREIDCDGSSADERFKRQSNKLYPNENSERVSRLKGRRCASQSLQSVNAPSTVSCDETSVSDDGTVGEGCVRLHISVKKIINPGNFYVSFSAQDEQINKLFDDMNVYYNSLESEPSTVEWNTGMKCAILKSDVNQWYRGIIEELLSDDEVKVLLKDIAISVVVKKSGLLDLADQFHELRDGAFKCHLAGVIAAGGQKTWPGISVDIFREQVDEANKKLFLSQKGEVRSSDKSIPAELWVKRTIIGGPFDPSRQEWCSINRFLIDQGFALPDKSSPPTPAPSTLHDYQSDASSSYSVSVTATNAHVSEWIKKSNLGSENVTGAVKKVPTPRKPVARSPIEQIQLDDVNISKDWLPPLPFQEKSFVGFPTYVDHSCNIYIQELSSDDTLNVIQNALWSRFKDSKPMPQDLFWFPGQLCIAQYHVDKKWYRAKVVEVDSQNKVTVEMVDYGNIEICKAPELRKAIFMTHIPLQCHKCSFKQLQPVSEDGKWSLPILDFIHASVVEKYCHVQIEGEVGNYNVASLKCPGGLDLTELLLNMNYARYILDEKNVKPLVDSISDPDDDDNASIIIEDEVEDDTVSRRSLSPPGVTGDCTEVVHVVDVHQTELGIAIQKAPSVADLKMTWYDLVLQDEKKNTPVEDLDRLAFKDINLPESINEFLAEVTSLLSPTSVMVQLYHENVPPFGEIKAEFNLLQDELQQFAQYQPKIKDPVPGYPCVTLYSHDQRWYRGLILEQCAGDLIKVRYVDYGNVEIISKDNVLEMKEEWMKVPQQGLQCFLWGIKIADVSNIKKCMELLDENIFISPILIKVKKRHPRLEVQLYKDDGAVFAYQKLIDDKIFITTEPETDDVN